MKSLARRMTPILDILLVFFVFPAAWLLKGIRSLGVHKMPLCKSALLHVGVFPIRDHYYEPQFDNRNPKSPLSQDRKLPGIDWNTSGQLQLLSRMRYAQELGDGLNTERGKLEFHLENGRFEEGDAEYWYQLIRTIKPQRIFEIGSGNSTLMALKAIRNNHKEDSRYKCQLVCIEPYEMPWLEEAGVEVIRKKVEDIDLSYFAALVENDILFIDSSHIIRPAGDVLFEYLALLPTLNHGVIVHVHDIFSPKNYPKKWIEEMVRFWNEQYLLEAFLTHNSEWTVLGSLNYLRHNYFDELKTATPFLTRESEPGSFYMQKRRVTAERANGFDHRSR